MSALPIPDRYYADLATLLSLPHEARERLKQALDDAPLKYYEADLAQFLEPKVAINKSALRAILGVLAALASVRALTEMPPELFARSLVESMNRTEREDLRVADELVSDFETTLLELLSKKAILVPAKAKSLLRSFENVICRARTITDSRPVYDDEPERVDAMVIVHSLNISYHHGTQLRDFFVTLDTDDLGRLIEVLQRARAKAETLKSVLQRAAVPVIDIE